MDRLDAVVVGAGPNGLAAAVTLARAGWRVLVFERAPAVGGGASSAELTLPGFLHDVCSAVHPLAAASPFFQALPLAQHGLEFLHPPIPLAHPLDDGSAVTLRRSVAETAAALGADGLAWRRLVEPLSRDFATLVHELLAPPHLIRSPLLLARFGLRGLRSARGLATGWFSTAPARALFAGLAAHAILPFERAGSAAPGLVLAAAGHAVGWPFVAGGSQRLADALASHLTSLGGRIETGVTIGSLADLPASRAMLLDLVPRGILAVTGEVLPARYRRRLQRFRHGPGIFKIDWALAAPIPWSAEDCRRAGTLHLGGTLEEIAASEAAVWAGVHPARPFVLVAQPTLVDPLRAPPGRHVAWAYCHVPTGSERDCTGEIEAQVERFAPGFHERVLARATATAREMEERNPNLVGGDITGGVTDLPQLLARPALAWVPYATPDRRLWICSSSTPPGPGVHGLCGHYAARAVLRAAARRPAARATPGGRRR